MSAHNAVRGKTVVRYLSSVYSAPLGKCKSHLRSPTKTDSKRYLERDHQSLQRRFIFHVHHEVHYNVQSEFRDWICILGLDTQAVSFLKHNVISSIHYLPVQIIQGGIRKPVFEAHLLFKIISFKSTPLTCSDKKCETVSSENIDFVRLLRKRFMIQWTRVLGQSLGEVETWTFSLLSNLQVALLQKQKTSSTVSATSLLFSPMLLHI